jgi:hypothetical protein
MKEDVLEQIVDDYLQFKGYFTTHNVRFKPDPGRDDSAHVLTLEDRRKAAAVTNMIRREKRAVLDQLELRRELEAGLAKREERRRRNREWARRRRLRET